jgi:hypothetical protein
MLQLLLTLISRSAGKVLNTGFAWATVSLFGQAPPRRQLYLSIMAFGSVAWIVCVIGVALPSVATMLLAFVTAPQWVQPDWIRLAMGVSAVLCPLLVGMLCLLMLDPENRPEGAAGKAKAVLKGYPVTIGMAVTIVLLLVFAPILKLRALARRWTTAHVPVLVDAEDYADVFHELEIELARAGWHMEPHPASWMLTFPTRVFTALGGGSISSLVAGQLMTLRAPRLEVTLHPSDMILAGEEADVMRARARIAEQMAFSRLYMTWTKEGQRLEDRLRKSWHQASRDPAIAIRRSSERVIGPDIAAIPYEEWEVLFRKQLLLERRLAGRGEAPREARAREACPHPVVARTGRA